MSSEESRRASTIPSTATGPVSPDPSSQLLLRQRRGGSQHLPGGPEGLDGEIAPRSSPRAARWGLEARPCGRCDGREVGRGGAGEHPPGGHERRRSSLRRRPRPVGPGRRRTWAGGRACRSRQSGSCDMTGCASGSGRRTAVTRRAELGEVRYLAPAHEPVAVGQRLDVALAVGDQRGVWVNSLRSRRPPCAFTLTTMPRDWGCTAGEEPLSKMLMSPPGSSRGRAARRSVLAGPAKL